MNKRFVTMDIGAGDDKTVMAFFEQRDGELFLMDMETRERRATMEDGIIELDTERGKEFGFVSSRFKGYLWKEDNVITISFIESVEEGKGHFSELLNNIWAKGYKVRVPTPFARMRMILKKKGFVEKVMLDEDMGEHVEVWEK
jgi:hypothetical protein